MESCSERHEQPGTGGAGLREGKGPVLGQGRRVRGGQMRTREWDRSWEKASEVKRPEVGGWVSRGALGTEPARPPSAAAVLLLPVPAPG